MILYADNTTIEAHKEQWRLGEVEQLASICDPKHANLTLGAALGGKDARVEHFKNKTKVVQAMHDKIRLCNSSKTEFVLSRAFLGVSKTTHLMRAAGLDLFDEASALSEFDGVQDATLGRLFGGVTQEGTEQASLCAGVGGLGMRRARDTALAAAIASRILARPKVADISQELFKAGLLDDDELIHHFDAVTDDATAEFLGTLDSVEAHQVRDMLSQARNEASEEWTSLKGGAAKQNRLEVRRARWTGFDASSADLSSAQDQNADAEQFEAHLDQTQNRQASAKLASELTCRKSCVD